MQFGQVFVTRGDVAVDRAPSVDATRASKGAGMGAMCGANGPGVVAWCGVDVALYADDGIPDCVDHAGTTCTWRPWPSSGRRWPEGSGNEDYRGDVGLLEGRGPSGLRRRGTAVAALLDQRRAHGTGNTPTAYRAVLETERRPREAAVAFRHLPAIQVDAPNVEVAARVALSHHIDSPADPRRRAEPRSGSS